MDKRVNVSCDLRYVHAYHFHCCTVRVESVVGDELTELERVYSWFADPENTRSEPSLTIRSHKNKVTFIRNGDDGSPREVVIQRGRLMPRLEREISQYLVGVLGDRLLLHAAAAGWGKHAIVLPANAGSGKSTLEAGLVQRGCGYLTDELIIIHPRTNKVIPFPKALSLKEGSFALFESLGPYPTGPEHDRVWYLDPEQLRPGSVVSSPTPVGWVVLPRYEAGAKTRVEALTVGETVLGLFENTVNMARHKEPGLDRLIAIAKKAPGYRLVFGDLEDACDAVLELVGGNDELRC